MTRRGLLGGLVLLVCLVADNAEAQKVKDVNPVPDHLVGFTTTVLQGDVGVFAMTFTCQLEFDDAHMCRVGEALSTVNVPDLSGPSTLDAWARPDHDPLNDVNCRGWSQLLRDVFPLTGTTLNKLGQSSHQVECQEFLSVACCAAVR